MKKPLLVTLADKKYLEYAKQVFAGAYFNAGWKGDYMLLAHDCSPKDTAWFRKKGILVKHCKPIYKKPIANTLPVIVSKLYLFTPEFKKWSHVIYVDADTIIRASFTKLLNARDFAAVSNFFDDKFSREIISARKYQAKNLDIRRYKTLRSNLEKKYDFREKVFDGGFFVFETKLLRKDTFKIIINLIKKYQSIAANADEFALNSYFYKKWQQLSPIYSLYILDKKNKWYEVYEKSKGIIVHFLGSPKPWSDKNKQHAEWKALFDQAEDIDLENIPEGNRWPESKILVNSYSFILKRRWLIFKEEGSQKFKYYIWLPYGIIYHIYFGLIKWVENKYPRIFLFFKNNKKRLLNVKKTTPRHLSR